MSNKKRWRIDFDWLNTYVVLIASERQFKLFLENSDNDLMGEAPEWGSYPGFVAEVVQEDGGMYFLVCFTNQMTAHDDIVHESTHLANSILSSRGIPTGHQNDELMAYTVAYLSRCIVNCLGADNVYHDEGGE